MGYAAAYAEQVRHVEELLAAREAGRPEAGRLLLVEHDPVITISNRSGAGDHLLATPDMLAREGVEVARTDRGGDITYHGPGQLVCYPILDLNLLNLGLHAYMRLLEDAVIAACADLGVPAVRDTSATGVWVPNVEGPQDVAHAKVCAMGVRVRRWISMHGLAINVDPNPRHFQLIVPCGLVGRPVTTLAHEAALRGRPAPTMAHVSHVLTEQLERHVDAALATAMRLRAASGDAGTKLIC